MRVGMTVGPRLYYRRRHGNEGRKPGNIGDWLRQWGGAYRYMLVLDADSVMSARRIAALIRRMETHPRLGMIQTGDPADRRRGRASAGCSSAPAGSTAAPSPRASPAGPATRATTGGTTR